MCYGNGTFVIDFAEDFAKFSKRSKKILREKVDQAACEKVA